MTAVSASLAADRRGVSTVEFALVLPALLVTMMGLTEIGFQAYAQSVLTGAVLKASRNGTIQGNSDTASSATLDAAVQAMVSKVIPNGTYVSTRANFDTYASIAGEPFTDTRYPANTGVYDGICNHGESYVDVNGNGKYDLDLSASGQGGANDVTKYTMAVTYTRLFPIGWLGWTGNNRTVTISATTIMKNQPYATQSVNSGTTVRTCA